LEVSPSESSILPEPAPRWDSRKLWVTKISAEDGENLSVAAPFGAGGLDGRSHAGLAFARGPPHQRASGQARSMLTRTPLASRRTRTPEATAGRAPISGRWGRVQTYRGRFPKLPSLSDRMEHGHLFPPRQPSSDRQIPITGGPR
jgi:hypothetical protein